MSNCSDLYIDFYYFAAVNYIEGQRLRQSPSECIDVIYGHEARGMHSDKEWETLVIFWWKYKWWMEWIFDRNEKGLWQCFLLCPSCAQKEGQWEFHRIDYTEMVCPSVSVWDNASVVMFHWLCIACHFPYDFPLRIGLIVSLHVFPFSIPFLLFHCPFGEVICKNDCFIF